MKKTLLALAVLGAFAGAASAQTAVTIYGSFDGGVRHVTNVDAAGDSITKMNSNGTYNSNRIGFKGVEDLGGGLNAHFVLESGFNNGTGTLDTPAGTTGTLFNRSAYVGLGGAFGSVDLGRQYSVNFKTIGAYDPFAYKYTAIIPLAAQGGLTRLNNDIQYTGTFGPVTARAEYALGEVAGNTSGLSTTAIGVGYATGPFSVGGAYTQRKNNLATVAPANYQDQKNWTVGGAFRTAAFSVAVGYADDKQDTGLASPADQLRIKDAWVGGSFNLSPAAALTAGYYETKASAANADGKRKLVIVGGTYALSKRTNFYADIDNAKFSGFAIGLPVTGLSPLLGSPAGQDRQTGVSVGINHLF
jgi:predicted porin